MQFDKKINDVCEFPDPIEVMDESIEDTDTRHREFNEECEAFKKEHGLENQYFSQIYNIYDTEDMFFEVVYNVSDLYLTYLEAKDCLPQGFKVERKFITKEYEYGTPESNKFNDAVILAIPQQKTPKIVYGKKLYGFDCWLGITEIIKVSLSVDGSLGRIIDRHPMLYDDLKNLKFE